MDKRKMQSFPESPAHSLLQLPDETIGAILRNLDASSLTSLERTCKFFTRKDSVSKLPLTEHVAREQVMERFRGDAEIAARFRNISWKERLYLEEDTGCGFDKSWCEEAGFALQGTNASSLIMRLTGMGPKLMLSNKSTADQPVLRWRLRVRGNTAVEFGVIPVNLPLAHTALHKCLAVANFPDERCMGFCSQITAGSLLPLKAPVMRGTILDIVARRGSLEVVLHYPPDAKEISWYQGQPVQRPYRGPSQVRFEQNFSPNHDIRLAVTSWAKANFEVLHTNRASNGCSIYDEWVSYEDLLVEYADDQQLEEQEGGEEQQQHMVTAATMAAAPPSPPADVVIGDFDDAPSTMNIVPTATSPTMTTSAEAHHVEVEDGVSLKKSSSMDSIPDHANGMPELGTLIRCSSSDMQRHANSMLASSSSTGTLSSLSGDDDDHAHAALLPPCPGVGVGGPVAALAAAGDA